jgi:hypothetical protein
MLLLDLSDVLLRRRLFRERPREHELGLEHCPGVFDHSVQCGRQKPDHWVLHPPLDRRDRLAGVAFVPVSVQRFGDDPELDHEVAGEVLGLRFPSLLPPQA